MAKAAKRVVYRFRGRKHHSHKTGWKGWAGRIIGAGIAFGPVAVTSWQINKANNDGGATVTSHIIACYTGYDIKSNTFPRFDKLAIGYAPIAGALIFRKIWSRVIR